MRLQPLIAAFIAVLFFSSAADAATTTPPRPILTLLDTMLAATNADNADALAHLYTSDAIVVDENPPYLWSGAGAGAAWWHVVQSVTKRMKFTQLKAVASAPTEFQQSAADAYIIVPVHLSGIAGGKAFHENGTMTYTFHRTAEGWKISSQVWTTGK
jgi:ketosteroid isomerase-like protein